MCAWLDHAAQHCRLVMLYLWQDLYVIECQPCLRAVCACDPAPAARGARTAEQLGGSFQWRRVGDRVARAGGGKGPLIFLYLHAWRTIVLASTSLCSWPAASACSALR